MCTLILCSVKAGGMIQSPNSVVSACILQTVGLGVVAHKLQIIHAVVYEFSSMGNKFHSESSIVV